ncbi:hypothetical protein ACHAWF_007164 [Thalassiosira exigua]
MTSDDINPKPILASNTSIQNANWSGSIPILLSIAPNSISSSTRPRPIHKMISRMTYLHVALHEEVMHFSSYAPEAGGLLSSASSMAVEEFPDPPNNPAESVGVDESEKGEDSGANADAKAEIERPESNAQSKESQSENITEQKLTAYPEFWFEDETTGAPLRWHLFVGVLFDLMKGRSLLNCSSWKGEPVQHNFLPWRIRLHFKAYPTEQLLPLDDGLACAKQADSTKNTNDIHSRITNLVGRIYRNSLKQALFLQYGYSKVAMSITKGSHEKIWNAVLQTDFDSYNEVNGELQSGIKQPPITAHSTAFDPISDTSNPRDVPHLVPVRMMLDGKPVIQKAIKHAKENRSVICRPGEMLEKIGTFQPPPYTTLGDVLTECLPNHFAASPPEQRISLSDSEVYCCIQGIQPSTHCAVVDLWRTLSHPDHFLYIIVVTK